MPRTKIKVSKTERFEKIMKSIASSEDLDMLEVCSKLVENFSKQISESDKTPMIKASLEGMLTLREYQIQKK